MGSPVVLAKEGVHVVWIENCSHLDKKLPGLAHAVATVVDYLIQDLY
jgi:hypothetical protein